MKDDAEGAGDSMINGIFYTGSWTKGKKHGMGEETDEDGNTVKGIWKNNVLIEKIEMEEDEDDD